MCLPRGLLQTSHQQASAAPHVLASLSVLPWSCMLEQLPGVTSSVAPVSALPFAMHWMTFL